MWTICTLENMPLIERCVAIYRAMAWKLQALTVASVRSMLGQERGELHYYRGENFELVMSFVYNRRRQNYYLYCGMDGAVTPWHALDFFVERARSFADQHAVSTIYAIRRPMDYDALEQMYNLLPFDPRLEITVLERTGGVELWRLAYRPAPVSMP